MSGFDLTSFGIALAVSIVATGLVRKYALHAEIIDVPNQRSSHKVTTPRGGGFSIVLVILGGVLLLFGANAIPLELFIPIFVGGFLVGGIGLVDDHSHVPAIWRFAVHFVAATFALVVLGGLPAIQIGSQIVDLGIIGEIMAVIFIVWMINLFNFMDGIDGIAAAEVICIAGGVLLVSAIPQGSFFGVLLTVLIASSLGFLVWNWPPAKIFMGDIGSGFVGFLLAILAIISEILAIIPIWSWLILSGVFIVDATVTLLARVVYGQRWYEAHNVHAYQKAAKRLGDHRAVTVLVVLINVCWLFPVAYFAVRHPDYGWCLTIAAWMPLAALSLWLRAGIPENDRAPTSTN